MARRRMIDPNIWQSEDFAELSLLAKLVFIGMFSNADDEGRGKAKAAYLKSIIFPYDDGLRVADIEKSLSEIAAKMSVTLYDHDGKQYYLFNSWSKWQRVDKPQPSKIPLPESFPTDSGITPESFPTDSVLKEKKRKESNICIVDTDAKASSPTKKELDSFFESIWGLYPEKKGKGQVSRSKKEALLRIGFDQISRCIERYKTSKPDWQGYQNGSTFFNSGYVDYLDENYTPSDKRKEDGYGEYIL